MRRGERRCGKEEEDWEEERERDIERVGIEYARKKRRGEWGN